METAISRIKYEEHKLNIDLTEGQFYGDVDRQIECQDKLKRLRENPEQYFKDNFLEWYDGLDTHKEKIKCPNCYHIQDAIVVHTLPWISRVHDCTVCKYTIMESEWNKIG